MAKNSLDEPKESDDGELGYWLSEDYWNKGIITAAVKQILPFAFDKLGLKSIHACTFKHNTKSQHVLEKCGFKHEADIECGCEKDGVTIDTKIFRTYKE